ncbi:MAG TPA: methionine gamma-lyase family protein [Bacilli bacterium]|nr:methionine gamma-lyase family protein [Bacilli bacterium]
MINIDEKLLEISKKCEEEIKTELKKIDDICMFNSMKVLNAFHEENISEIHFNTSTGYGYNDIGRDKIEDVYKRIFKCEDALVRTQFISGSHALTVCLFGLLRPNDTFLSITGKPYDTLDEVIGITPNDSSLKSFGVNYEQIDLVDNNFDFKKIEERLNKDFVKVIEIQRSKGYSTRKSISIENVEEVIKLIKKVSPKTIVMIDNCYCEFVSYKEPTEVGADVAVGSLIKNLGGGITPNGAYIVGKKDLINLVAERLTVPGQGKEVGPSLGFNKQILQGLFLAPLVVANSLKTAIFTSKIMETLGYDVEPKYNEERVDIVQNIIFNNKDDLINYCKGIQKSSAIDSSSIPVPTPTPGYDDEVIMASGSFTQGSSIEFSCDGPIRPPYIAYQQGSLTYEYGKLGVLTAIKELNK